MAGPRHRRQQFQAQVRGSAALLLLVSLLVGCKSGSWAAKPSWWGGGAGSSLASAPAFEGEVKKPSDAAKPYPTTETPEAYSLARAPGGAASPTTSAAPAVEPTSVTYGATPPPTSQAAAPPAAVAPAQPAAPIGPQVGPYASLQPAPATPAADPAAAVTAGFAAAPAFGEAAAPTAPTRVADARGADSWASAPPPAAGIPDPRYGTATGSRFSTAFPPGAQPEPTPTAPLAAPPAPLAPPAAPVAPPASPSIDPVPAATAPGLPPATPPAAVEALPGTISPPQRRTAPGYRPGGTSNYRRNGAILADDDPAGGVVPASFEAAPATGQ